MTFDSVKARCVFCKHRVSFVETRRMNYNLTLKGHLKIWSKVKVMTWSKNSMSHINRSVSSVWTHPWCFRCSRWSLSKVIAAKLLVTFHDVKWLWQHAEGSLFTIFRLKVSSLAATRCLRVFEWFSSKRGAFHFSPIEWIGDDDDDENIY